MINIKSKTFINIIAVSSILLFGCVNDLDVEIVDPNTFLADDFYSTPESYKQGLAGVYGNLTLTGTNGPGSSNITGLDAGTSQYMRGYWFMQELPTDEAIWSFENDPGIKDLNRTTWTADNVLLQGFYSRAMVQVAFANEYLKQTNDSKLNSRGVSGDLRDEIRTYRAEVRFLRALAYYNLMDLYGKVPFVTENDPIGSYQAPQYERKEIFNFIETELLTILPDLKDARSNEYARADKACAWMVLAKIYINAEVFINEPKYDDSLIYCQKIIDAGYTLSPIYLNNFNSDNDTNTAKNEIIFPVISDSNTTLNFGPPTMLIMGQVGISPDNSSVGNGGDFGVRSFGWRGALRVTEPFSDIMLNGNYDLDDRNTIIIENHTKEVTSIEDVFAGYLVGKWSKLTSQGTQFEGSNHLVITDGDFPMFRLADVLLMYAECAIKGANGSSLELAKDYINELRERAQNPIRVSVSDLNLDFLLEERAVELYWEGHRRQDLVRFNKFTGGSYNWSWKGNTSGGSEISDHLSVYPIPRLSLSANPNLIQNNNY